MITRTQSFDELSLREFLRVQLRERHQVDSDTVLIDEMGVCQGKARVDVAVVNGRLHGYEIKSERDNLRRLGSQAAMYNRVFDQITLVCWCSHTLNALEIIPPWWGVEQISSDGFHLVYETLREGKRNPDQDVRAVVELLWRDEAMNLLSRRHSLRGLRGKPRTVIWEKVCELFTLDEVASAVRSHLKATASLRVRPRRQP